MTEFMGLVHGAYDAKAEGFLPGGASLHNCMTRARPRRRDLGARDAMPSSSRTRSRTRWRSCSRAASPCGSRAMRSESSELQHDYFEGWQGLKKHFGLSRLLRRPLGSSQ